MPRRAAPRARSSPQSRGPSTARPLGAAAHRTPTGEGGAPGWHAACGPGSGHRMPCCMRVTLRSPQERGRFGSKAAWQEEVHTVLEVRTVQARACSPTRPLRLCATARRLVARRCMGRRSCWVRASNIQFGVNPCPAIKPKYLFFKYKWAGAGATGLRCRRVPVLDAPAGLHVVANKLAAAWAAHAHAWAVRADEQLCSAPGPPCRCGKKAPSPRPPSGAPAAEPLSAR